MLVFALRRVSGFKLEFFRLPSAAAKRIRLGAVTRTSTGMPTSSSRAGTLERVIAQIDVSFPNSTIEAGFRSIQHQWWFLHQLSDLATVTRLIELLVTEHNAVLPHRAFHGQTPDEKYFGQGDAVPGERAAQRQDARRRRLERNQEVACSACPRSSLLPKEDVAA